MVLTLFVFLCENKVSSEASNAFLGLWRCVACGGCENLVCPCSIEDFRRPCAQRDSWGLT